VRNLVSTFKSPASSTPPLDPMNVSPSALVSGFKSELLAACVLAGVIFASVPAMAAKFYGLAEAEEIGELAVTGILDQCPVVDQMTWLHLTAMREHMSMMHKL
jgi:hypothetical protein